MMASSSHIAPTATMISSTRGHGHSALLYTPLLMDGTKCLCRTSI